MCEERDIRAIYESRRSFESIDDVESHVKETFGELDFLFDCKAIARAIAREKDGGYETVGYDEFNAIGQSL